MLYVVVLVVMLFCGLQAVRTVRLMNAAIWLAGMSALMATLLYGLGAAVAAVIELSVGAGLVTVLFIFAISLMGDEPLPAYQRSVVPKWLAFALVFAFVALLILFTLLLIGSDSPSSESSFTETFWHERSADTLAQIALIFAGALSVLGLLTERRSQAKRVFAPAQETALREEQRL